MATHYNAKIVTDKLVFCMDVANVKAWPGSGTTMFDLMGNGYDGTFSPTPPTVTNGNLVFNGTDTNISYTESNISKDPSLFLGGSTGQLTYEAWVYRTGTSFDSVIRVMSTDASDYSAIIMDTYGAGVVRWSTSNNGVGDHMYATAGAPLSTWTHIACTYDGQVSGTNKYIYINGVEDSSADAGLELGTYGTGLSKVFAISANVEASHTNTHCFNGYINIARIYGKALSAVEVLQNYNAMRGRFGV